MMTQTVLEVLAVASLAVRIRRGEAELEEAAADWLWQRGLIREAAEQFQYAAELRQEAFAFEHRN